MPRPNGRDPEADPAAYLGKLLRQARLAAGYASQDALAAALGFERSTITKAESGARPPTEDVFNKWCDVCGITSEYRNVLMGLTTLARHADGPVPTWFEDYLEIEGEAYAILVWQPIVIPGLLQTEDYARALFLAEEVDITKTNEMVTARMARQAVFDRADAPQVVFVLDELVLHRLIGSPAIMAAQLAHICEMSERSEGRPDVVLMETVEDQTSEKRRLVRKAQIVFDRVRRDALPRVTSRTIILEAAERWKSH